ncbi:hypothetical protein R6Q57_010050 [Mikania cordata]
MAFLSSGQTGSVSKISPESEENLLLFRGEGGRKKYWESTNCSTSTSQLSFVPKTDFVEKFDEIKIKPNDMLKGFEKTCAINHVSKLTSSPLTKQAAPAYSTVTKEAGSQLNPNCEPYVPTGSLEQVSSSLSSAQSNCDVKPFDPIEFHQKVCCYVCGRPGHIARNCLHRPTEFFYGKNQKVTPKAKPSIKSMRTDQSSKPRAIFEYVGRILIPSNLNTIRSSKEKYWWSYENFRVLEIGISNTGKISNTAADLTNFEYRQNFEYSC